jgi:DNA (cytosine-5)-methyltransferase 1
VEPCVTCEQDQAFLRATARPKFEDSDPSIRVVDLFSGCGGLSLGLAEAARRRGMATEIALAVDIDPTASGTFQRNFPEAVVKSDDVGDLFDGELGKDLTAVERVVADDTGRVDVLVSGAPCQGNSDLNNHTRRRDPRNALYLRAVRAAAVLQPSIVLLENVPAVQHDSGGVVGKARASLAGLGYRVSAGVLNLSALGIPQTRRRHFIVALLGDRVDPEDVLNDTGTCASHPPRSVRWAIGDLEGRTTKDGFHAASRASADNQARMRWLFENNAFDLPNEHRPVCHQGDHSYTSMYGRLSWDQPAQTITTGFGSMGQGRYVHPGERRTLTPHEAARLQTFPDFFDFGRAGRGALATMIGNAVPPLVSLRLGLRVLPVLAHDGGEIGQTVSERQEAMQAPQAPLVVATN